MKLQNLVYYEHIFAEKHINAEKETRITYTIKPEVTIPSLLSSLYLQNCQW